MALQDILIKKLEYQIFAWQKEIERFRDNPPHQSAPEGDKERIAVVKDDPQEYIERLERNLEAARSKMDEVRQADEKRLLELKQQLSDWMD
jgi:hypothetical protein